jgi:putative FmdB family regulatory protein
MPTYVYRNLSTGETFEVKQRMTDDALTEHPETGDPVKRLIQPVGIAFKGSGFYVTDSRSSNGAGKPAASADKADQGDKSDKSDKGEAKASSEPSTSAASSDGATGAKADTGSVDKSKGSTPASGSSGES